MFLSSCHFRCLMWRVELQRFHVLSLSRRPWKVFKSGGRASFLPRDPIRPRSAPQHAVKQHPLQRRESGGDEPPVRVSGETSAAKRFGCLYRIPEYTQLEAKLRNSTVKLYDLCTKKWGVKVEQLWLSFEKVGSFDQCFRDLRVNPWSQVRYEASITILGWYEFSIGSSILRGYLVQNPSVLAGLRAPVCWKRIDVDFIIVGTIHVAEKLRQLVDSHSCIRLELYCDHRFTFDVTAKCPMWSVNCVRSNVRRCMQSFMLPLADRAPRSPRSYRNLGCTWLAVSVCMRCDRSLHFVRWGILVFGSL